MNSPTAIQLHASASAPRLSGNGAKAGVIALAFFLFSPAVLAAEQHLKFTITGENKLAISRVPAAYSNLSAYAAGVADTSGVTVSRSVMADISATASKLPYALRDNIRLPPATIGEAVKSLFAMSPYKIAGTLLAGYLLEKGIEYVSDQWVKKTVNPASSDWQSNNLSLSPTQYAVQECSYGAPISMQGTGAVVASYSVIDSPTVHVLVANCIPGTLNKNVSVATMPLAKSPYVANPLSAPDLSAAIDGIVSSPAKAKDAFESIKKDAVFTLPAATPAGFDLPADSVTPAQTTETVTTTNPDGSTTTKTKTAAIATTSTQTGTTISDGTATVTRTAIETTTTPDGKTETKVTPVPPVIPKTIDDVSTQPDPVSCNMLNNCDWAKDSTLKDIRDGKGVTQPKEETDKKPAIQTLDDQAKSQVEQFAKPDTPFADWFNFMPHYTCVNPKLGNGVMSWTVPICDHVGMMQEVMNFLWTLTAIITNIYLFFSRKPNE